MSVTPRHDLCGSVGTVCSNGQRLRYISGDILAPGHFSWAVWHWARRVGRLEHRIVVGHFGVVLNVLLTHETFDGLRWLVELVAAVLIS